jgi:hypothetical protein
MYIIAECRQLRYPEPSPRHFDRTMVQKKSAKRLSERGLALLQRPVCGLWRCGRRYVGSSSVVLGDALLTRTGPARDLELNV